MPSCSRHSCYGVVPLKKEKGKWQVLVIQRHEGFWEFPKGHAEGEEEPFTTACRELKEETGLDVVKLLDDNPSRIAYTFEQDGRQVDKTVEYYLCLVEGELSLQREELTDGKWVEWENVEPHLTYDNTQKMVAEIKKQGLINN